MSILFLAPNAKSNLYFHINAPFGCPPSRDSVSDTEDNKVLVAEIAELVYDAIIYLRDNRELTPSFFNVLPLQSDQVDSFYNPIKDTIIKIFSQEAVYPTISDGYKKKVEVLSTNEQIRKLFPIMDMRTLMEEHNVYGLMIESLQNPKEYELFRDDFSKSNGDPANEIARRNRSNANNVDAIKSGMREYVQEFNRNLSADMENLTDFIAEYNQIKDQSLVNSEAQAKQAFIMAQTSFNANFISNLRSRIEHAKDTLDGLNYTLKHHPFGGDGEYYQFRMQDSGDREMKEYADIIMSGKEMGQKDLFTETLDTHERDIMQSLFDKVATINDSTLAAKDLNKYLDYRQYKSYDIEVINKNGEKYFFSKNNDGKSGGEKQTPFYVIIGSCYNELIKKDETESGACIAIFDEAFNNMDEPRIMTLMEYYRKLNIQLIIVVPTNHSSNIIPYVNNVVEIIKRDNVINLAYLYNE